MTDVATAGVASDELSSHDDLFGETAADQDIDGDEDDEDIAPRERRRPAERRPAEPSVDEDDDDDLFGDTGADGDASSKPLRQLDDEELDSGDDLERDDRAGYDEDMLDAVHDVEREIRVQSAEIARHRVPKGSDGEIYLMKIPQFLGVDPKPFTPPTFEAPTTDHHSKSEPSATFNAYKTAMSTIRWRKSPSNPSKMQSNARILRWSDGSLTMQFASQPTKQYLIPATTRAPPQFDPAKPTPVSLSSSNPKNKRKVNRTTNYSAEKDSFTYLAAPSNTAQLLRTTNKITVGLSIQPTDDANQEALIKLQQSLAARANRNSIDGSSGALASVTITEDPEMAKKKAEKAEKEKEKLRKRRAAAEEKNRERAERALGGRGLGTGLTVGGLEDDDELGEGRQRLPPIGRSKGKAARNRRGEIYSDDEEQFGRRGRAGEDEYEEDGFLVRSGDEEEEAEEEDDDDDDLDEGIDLGAMKRSSEQKRRTPSDDAEGEPDDDAAPANIGDASPVSRSKRRRVIEDDDDDDGE